MSDLTITRDGELMIAQVQGETEGGVELVDDFFPSSPDINMTVLDSGRILIPDGTLEEVLAMARERGLTWEEEG